MEKDESKEDKINLDDELKAINELCKRTGKFSIEWKKCLLHINPVSVTGKYYTTKYSDVSSIELSSRALYSMEYMIQTRLPTYMLLEFIYHTALVACYMQLTRNIFVPFTTSDVFVDEEGSFYIRLFYDSVIKSMEEELISLVNTTEPTPIIPNWVYYLPYDTILYKKFDIKTVLFSLYMMVIKMVQWGDEYSLFCVDDKHSILDRLKSRVRPELIHYCKDYPRMGKRITKWIFHKYILTHLSPLKSVAQDVYEMWLYVVCGRDNYLYKYAIIENNEHPRYLKKSKVTDYFLSKDSAIIARVICKCIVPKEPLFVYIEKLVAYKCLFPLHLLEPHDDYRSIYECKAFAGYKNEFEIRNMLKDQRGMYILFVNCSNPETFGLSLVDDIGNYIQLRLKWISPGHLTCITSFSTPLSLHLPLSILLMNTRLISRLWTKNETPYFLEFIREKYSGSLHWSNPYPYHTKPDIWGVLNCIAPTISMGLEDVNDSSSLDSDDSDF